MKLKEYVANLTRFLEERPETSEYNVVTSIDDEGNGYNLVYYEPSAGYYEDGEFQSEGDEELEMELNAVCVN